MPCIGALQEVLQRCAFLLVVLADHFGPFPASRLSGFCAGARNPLSGFRGAGFLDLCVGTRRDSHPYDRTGPAPAAQPGLSTRDQYARDGLYGRGSPFSALAPAPPAGATVIGIDRRR